MSRNAVSLPHKWDSTFTPVNEAGVDPSDYFIGQRPIKKGILSLVGICLRVLGGNIEEASAEALECLPLKVLCRLSDEVVSNGITFCGWKLLSKVFSKQASLVPVSMYAFHQTVDSSISANLSVYTRPLSSPTVDFIARLVLDTAWAFDVSQLLTLADMANLGILELRGRSDPDTGTDAIADPSVSDRLVRGWSEKERPFPNLRVLKLMAPYDVTLHSLKYASRFPSLTLCELWSTEVRRSSLLMQKFNMQAEEPGWKYHCHYHNPLGGTHHPWKPWDHEVFFMKEPEFFRVSLLPCTGSGQRKGVEDWYDIAPRDLCKKERSYLYYHTNCYYDQIATQRLNKWAEYIALGDRTDNQDLVSQGVLASYRATLPDASREDEEAPPNSMLLPFRPMASIEVSTDSARRAYGRDVSDKYQAWFMRDSTPTMGTSSTNLKEERNDDQARKRKGPPVRQKPGKRQKLGDLLSY